MCETFEQWQQELKESIEEALDIVLPLIPERRQGIAAPVSDDLLNGRKPSFVLIDEAKEVSRRAQQQQLEIKRLLRERGIKI